MTVQEMMERTGISTTGVALEMIADGLEEIELHTGENIMHGTKMSIQKQPFRVGPVNFLTETSTQGEGTFDAQEGASDSPPEGWTEISWALGGLTGAPNLKYLQTANTGVPADDLYPGLTMYLQPGGDDIAEAQFIGIYQEFNCQAGTFANQGGANIKGLKVRFSYEITGDLYDNMEDSDYRVIITNVDTFFDATSLKDLESASGFYYDTKPGIGVHTGTFVLPNRTNLRIYLLLTGTEAGGSFPAIDNIFFGCDYIYDSSGRMEQFSLDQKIKVEGSKSNDTDNASVAPKGYYTPAMILPNVMYLSDIDTPLNEDRLRDSTSNLLFKVDPDYAEITVTGLSHNYIDIIKDKRFHQLPTDFVKLKDVKVKNHLNGSNKYKSIPRLMNPPTEHDMDNI